MQPPPFRQNKDDNCALACLRSILFVQALEVDEHTLEILANKQEWGVEIEELAKAARHFGLQVEIVQLDLPAISRCLVSGWFPIVYLNRVHLEKRFPLEQGVALRLFTPHAVVPTRVSPKFVTFNDPRPGLSRRVSRRKFDAAQRDLSRWCVVCKPG